MMARLWVWGAVALLLSISAAQAQAQDRTLCPAPGNLKTPTVQMQVVEPRLVYRHDVDLANLPRFGNTMERAPPHGVILGLTLNTEPIQLQARSLSLVLRDHRVCVWLSDVVVATLGGPEMDVFVAANYPVNSCEYRVVLEHENTHVAIYRSALKYHAPRIEAALKKVLSTSFPMIFPGPVPPNQVLNILHQRIKPAQDAMFQEMRARNGAIDTPEAYRSTSRLCKNWFPKGTKLPNGKVAP